MNYISRRFMLLVSLLMLLSISGIWVMLWQDFLIQKQLCHHCANELKSQGNEQVEIVGSDGLKLFEGSMVHAKTRFYLIGSVGTVVVVLLTLGIFAVFKKHLDLSRMEMMNTTALLEEVQLEGEFMHEKLVLSELMFRNLFEGSPVPMIQIDYTVETEELLQRYYRQWVDENGENRSLVIDEHPDIFAKLNEGMLDCANTAAVDFFAVNKNVFDHTDISWFIQQTDEVFQIALINLIARQRSFSSFECEVTPLIGAKRSVVTDFSVIESGKDRESIVVTFQDITEQKHEHEVALEAKEAAEEANRLKSSFLSNMSHELKTPLNAIIGFSDLLHEGVEDEGHKEQLQLIEQSGRHLLGIVKDILELTKNDINAGDLNYSLFGLQEFVADFLVPFRSIAEVKNLIINHASEQAEGVYCFCDQGKLHHILSNLTDNALKFTHDGGVTIEANCQIVGPGILHRISDLNPFLQSEIRQLIEQEFDNSEDAALCRLQFSVADTGMGIDADAMKRIFEPFIQGDCSETRRYGGTGLGLTVCRRLVDSMGGVLKCDNLPDGGAKFEVEVYGVTTMSGEL